MFHFDFITKNIFGYAGGLVCILAAFVYLKAIINGKVYSNKLTWGVWSLVTFMICVYYYQAVGLVSSSWVGIAYFLGTLITFITLVFYVKGSHWTWVESTALVGVIISLILRILLDSPTLGLFFIMFIDAIGAIPLILTVYRDSHSEYGLAWLLGLVSNIINLFAVEKWDYNNAGYPIYMAILTFVVTFLIYFPRGFNLKVKLKDNI